MKLLIAVDMEGATGIVSWGQVDPSTSEYLRCRHLLTADVNAAIAGACDAAAASGMPAGSPGGIEIQVSDGHWNSGNVLIEELDVRARLNTGTSSPFSMVQMVQEGVDAVFFVGYHAMAGSKAAILDHTWSSVRVHNLWINDRLAGETGLNGSVCGAFGAPVLLVTGDQTVAAEARDWIPGVTTAVVKQAAGRVCAQCLPAGVTGPLIREKAALALSGYLAGKAPSPIATTTPVRIRIEFANSQMADMAVLMPGAERVDGRSVAFQSPDMASAYLAFRACVNLASI